MKEDNNFNVFNIFTGVWQVTDEDFIKNLFNIKKTVGEGRLVSTAYCLFNCFQSGSGP